MTHLELENLASEYLEGQLEEDRRLQLEAHLASCNSCRDLLNGLRRVMELCRSAEDLEPAPWLVSKILLATVGETKASLKEQLAAFFRPAVQPRFAYAVAMAVFSVSIIVNAAGINLRNVSFENLNPRTWIYRANRTGHLLYARAEKFYYDLRIVYEIESRFRQLRAQPDEGEKEAPKSETPPAGSTDRKPLTRPQLASIRSLIPALRDQAGAGPDAVETGRSPSR